MIDSFPARLGCALTPLQLFFTLPAVNTEPVLRVHRGWVQRASGNVEAAGAVPCHGPARALARPGRGGPHHRDRAARIITAGGGPSWAWRDRSGCRIRAGLRMDPA